MADEEMDIYPIEHKGKVYSIITSFDMTFREVRGMLDWLSEQKAFSLTPEDEFMGPGKIFHCDVEGVTFEGDVHGEEVGRKVYADDRSSGVGVVVRRSLARDVRQEDQPSRSR